MKALYKMLLCCVLCLNTAGFTAVHAEGEDIPQEPVPAETATETAENTSETAPAEGTEAQPEETPATADTAEGETGTEGTEVLPEETPAATEPEGGEVAPEEPAETAEPEETIVPEETASPEETAEPTAEPAGETAEPEVKEDEPAETAAPEAEAAESETEVEEAELIEETEELEEVEEEIDEVEEELEEPEELLEASGYSFNISDNEATITGYSGSSKVISIPNTVKYSGKTYEVTGINTSDFKNSNITELTLPANLRSMNHYVFSNCRKLTKVTINARSLDDCDYNDMRGCYCPFYNSGSDKGVEVVFGSGVSKVPAYLFATYEDRVKEHFFRVTKVTIPSSVGEIGTGAFENCYLLKTAVINGAGVIKKSAFYNTSLTSLKLPGNTTSIGNSAFQNTDIKTLTLPKGLKSIGTNAFANIRKLTKVTINSKSLNDCTNSDYWGNYCPFYNSGSDKGVEVVFGSSVSRIPEYLFATFEDQANRKYFRATKVTIPTSVKEIAKGAFCNCYKLKTAMYNGSSTKFNNLVVRDYNGSLLRANEYYTYYHLVFVRRNGKYYWYENNKRQAVKGDPKNLIDQKFHTERGREIFDPKTKAWYWLDAVYGGAKATGKEVWMPYVYQNEKSWSYEDKVRMANESDSGMEGLVLNAMLNGDGKWVRYDGNGKMLKGWVTIEDDLAEIYPTQKGKRYYYDTHTGMMARGYVKMGYWTYHFDETTGALID